MLQNNAAFTDCCDATLVPFPSLKNVTRVRPHPCLPACLPGPACLTLPARSCPHPKPPSPCSSQNEELLQESRQESQWWIVRRLIRLL
jgi:hypothetical protein